MWTVYCGPDRAGTRNFCRARAENLLMASITREQFVSSFQGRSIDIANLTPELRKDLAAAGITAAELKQIAGADGVIQGGDELGKLFKEIDKLDRDGAYRTLVTSDANGKTTQAGELIADLRAEVEKNRLRTPVGPAKLPPSTSPSPATAGATKGTPGKDAAGPSDAPWVKTAFAEKGVKETAGDDATKRILQYFDRTYQKGLHTDDTGRKNAWCAAFITFAMSEHGIKTGKAVGAREFEKWGEASEPFRGAVVVLQHGNQKHVAILAGVDAKGNNVYLGGNQDNAVNLSTFPNSEILAVRKPKGYEIPADLKTLPQIDATKATSSR